jgi:hypothetical protein
MLLEEATATPTATPSNCLTGWYVSFDGCDTLAYQIELGQVVPYFVDTNSPPNALRTGPDNFHTEPDAVMHKLRITIFIPESAVMHGFGLLIRNEDAQAWNGTFRVRDRTTGEYSDSLTVYYAGGSWTSYFTSPGVDWNLTNVSEFQIEYWVVHALPHNPVGYIDSIGLNLSNVTVTPTFTPTDTPSPTPTPTETPTPTFTPTPVSTGLIPFDPNEFSESSIAECDANYTGDQNQACRINVSIQHLIELRLEQFNRSLTHQELLRIIIYTEYLSSELPPEIDDWMNEAVARRYYQTCGADGCTNNAELYAFLAYYVSAISDGLLINFETVLRVDENSASGQQYWQNVQNDLDETVRRILDTPEIEWTYGVEGNEPYGFASAQCVATDASTLAQYQACGVAVNVHANSSTPPAMPNGEIFFGTTLNTDGEGICVVR